MALPRDPELDNQQRELERLNQDRRVGAWWWWLWIAIIIAVVWFGGWGWGGYGGWWWGGRSRVARYPQRVSGSGVAVLNSNNKGAFVGQQFYLVNVPVQKKVNDQVLWIGSNNSAPMLLIVGSNSNSGAQGRIGRGNLISVSGTVQKAPPASEAKQEWNLSDNGIKRLENEGAYMQAAQLQQAARTHQ
jgi:hypothetical protein